MRLRFHGEKTETTKKLKKVRLHNKKPHKIKIFHIYDAQKKKILNAGGVQFY